MSFVTPQAVQKINKYSYLSCKYSYLYSSFKYLYSNLLNGCVLVLSIEYSTTALSVESLFN